MIRLLQLSLLVLLTLPGLAQNKTTYRKKYYMGYLVTNYNDTLRGRIKRDQSFKDHVKFINDNDTSEKKVTVSISDIKAMKLNLMLFEKVNYRGKTQFLEKVAYGHYTLFAFKYLRNELPESKFIFRLPETSIEVKEDNFRQVMETYFFDCPEIREKIITNQYTFDHVLDVFRHYNRWKAGQL